MALTLLCIVVLMQGWIDQQREFAALEPWKRDVWVQVQLDGTVRSSGVGEINWAKLVEDLPILGDIRTTFTDGIGPNDQ